jgi:hypothetical protein
MELIKGKKYKVLMSGMVIKDGGDTGPYEVILDKCIRARIIGIGPIPILQFTDKVELNQYCTHNGALKIGRRVYVTLDVVVIEYHSSTIISLESYRTLLQATDRLFQFGTYKLATNLQFDVSVDEFTYVSENTNDPEPEWPEEAPGVV